MSARRIDRVQLARLLDIEESFIIELEEHEIVVQDAEGRFDVYAVERVRVCWTMRQSLGVNTPGLEVALDLLDRWQSERRRVHTLLVALKRERDQR